MPLIHPFQPNESIDLVIRHLAEGACVALPAEATYEVVTSALDSNAPANLRAIASAEQVPAIVLGDYANILDWLPLLRGAGPRLFRKMGAGPITLTAIAGFSHGLWSRLPDAARRLTVRQERLAVRWPAHAIWDELRRCGLPLVSVPVKEGINAEETARLAGESVACLIDAGPTEFGKAPTIVEADGRLCRVVREGALTAEQIDDLAMCRILFICTGNTCRSPMAQAFCAKLLADRLGCAPNELNRRGFCVQSAGLAAMMGQEASPDAVRVAADFGADVAPHRSRSATMEMLLWADHVFAMTASHAYALEAVPNIPQPRLLSLHGDDVVDPIGGALADYRTCAEQIIQCLQQRLPEILES